jgi:N-acetylmuramoyl-L-alanine amidase
LKIAVIYDVGVIKGNLFWNMRVFVCALMLILLSSGSQAGVFEFLSGNLSPKNRERPLRPRTDYIVLHTTEGREQGSLQKLVDKGEANYFVASDGRVLRIIERKRVAFHAGTSMWNGKVNIDNYSIGIEVQGTYYGDITSAQYGALRDLLAELQGIYDITDDRVLTHSMVAYGTPNRWHCRPHRGRKRCGMLFAKTGVRARLGLLRRPAYDPDVYAGRLVVGDPYLAQVLYGSAPEQDKAIVRYVSTTANIISKDRSAWDISGDDYNSAKVLYVFPDKTQLRGNQIKDWKKIPVGTKVIPAP